MGIEPESEAWEVRVRLNQDGRQPVSLWTFFFEVLTTVTFAEQGGRRNKSYGRALLRRLARPPRISRGWKWAGLRAWSTLPNS